MSQEVPAGAVITMNKSDFDALVAQMKAEADRNKKNIGREGYIYASNADRDEKIEMAQHVFKALKLAMSKDTAGYENHAKAYPEWYGEKAVFSDANNGEGLYAVPTAWSDQIFSNVERFGYARKLGTVIPLSARTTNFNAGGAVTVSWPGANTAPTIFDATSYFTQTALTVNTMAAAYAIQRELLDDTNVAILAHLARVYGKAIAKEEDLQFFNGTGSPFTGICTTSGVNTTSLSSTKTAFTDVAWTDMVDLKLSVNPDIQAAGVYVVSSTAFGNIQKEVDDNHRPIYSNERPMGNNNNTGIDQAPYIYNGSPMWVVPNAIMPTSAAAKTAAVFGDFKNYSLLGVRRSLTMDTFTEYYNGQDLAGKRQVAYAFTERISLGFPDPTAFGVLKTAAS